MRSVFLDSSVLLSFCKSSTGASALIMRFCRQGKLKGYISKKVVAEVQKNNSKDENTIGIQKFGYVLSRRILTVVEDGVGEDLEEANRSFNNPKDASVIVAAKQTPDIRFILSLDNGFFKSDVKSYVKPIEIIKPGKFIEHFREELEK